MKEVTQYRELAEADEGALNSIKPAAKLLYARFPYNRPLIQLHLTPSIPQPSPFGGKLHILTPLWVKKFLLNSLLSLLAYMYGP